MGGFGIASMAVVLLIAIISWAPNLEASAGGGLRRDFYGKTCPNVEKIVRKVVEHKVRHTFVTIPATLRLFFHDCMVNGCDASVLIASTRSNTAEKDSPDDSSLAGDGFDTVIRAKEAVEAAPGCKNTVSCADILAIAARDVINLAGGPYYLVELGRRDGKLSTAASVNGRLPKPTFDLDELTSVFASVGLSRTDLIALSGAHTVGFAHCTRFQKRLYHFSANQTTDPRMDPEYAARLKAVCPPDVDPRMSVNMDPFTSTKFDNVYYRNLVQHRGLFTSDQVLFDDPRSRPLVLDWARNSENFFKAFVEAITKLGRVGVKTGTRGDIRLRCDAFN